MPTAAQIDAARTPKGGWTKAILAGWGVSWPPPKGWRDRLIAEAVNAQPVPGRWPITELHQSQCRFICTPHYGPRDGHLCCGEPTTIGPGNPHGSWCDAHRAVVFRDGTVEGDGAEAEGMAA